MTEPKFHIIPPADMTASHSIRQQIKATHDKRIERVLNAAVEAFRVAYPGEKPQASIEAKAATPAADGQMWPEYSSSSTV